MSRSELASADNPGTSAGHKRTGPSPVPPPNSTLALKRILAWLSPSRHIRLSLRSPLWTLIERLYALPNRPPRRARVEPMQVLCVGLPRTGTESLQQALLALGYRHTYHGWDIVYDDAGCYAPGWVALARRKWYSPPGAAEADADGNAEANAGPKPSPDNSLTAADFDALLGHSTAVTDAAASVFAAEMVAAYPDAKVVLNMRRDEAAWARSLERTLVHANASWGFWIASWLDRECFWAWHVYERLLWPLLFRAADGDMAAAIRGNARWVMREHCNMIRGLVPEDRLLEWYIEDGWEPLCRFLGKPVPSVPFPHANAAGEGGGWKAREEQCNKRWVERAFARLIVLLLVVFGLAGSAVMARG